MTDPALTFFVRWSRAQGALAEEDDRATLLVLPEELQRDLDVPDEWTVTADPDVARDEGATLLIAGHPVVAAAAERTIRHGDTGRTFAAWPDGPPPSREALLSRARDRFSVDHARIEAAGHPARSYLPVLRIGAVVTYSVSLDERFHEREEAWLDAHNRLVLAGDLYAAVTRGSASPGVAQNHPVLTADFVRTAREADVVIRAKGTHRLDALARYSREARDLELARAAAYYDAVTESIARRRAAAAPDRAAVLDAQAEATRGERERRMAEIEDTFRPTIDVRPFRAHLVLVPALRVPVTLRRGSRSFPFSFVWVLEAGAFAPVRCPSCGAAEALVAGRQSLGCRGCLGPSLAPAAANGDEPGAGDKPAPVPARPDNVVSAPAPSNGHGSVKASAPRPAPQRRAAVQAPNQRLIRAHEERVAREGSKLATRVIETAVTEGRWPNRALERHSPAKVLQHLFGPAGPLIAIGMLADELPLRIRTATAAPHRDELESTAGLLDTGLAEYGFTLRWRMESGHAVLCEVLPFEKVLDALLPPLTKLGGRAARLTTDVPSPRVELDAVGRVLWTEALPVVGLPIVVRCLACWGRVREELEAAEPPVSAAALLEVVGTTAQVRPAVEVARSIADPGEAGLLAMEVRKRLSRVWGW